MFSIFSKKAKKRKELNRSHIKSLWEVVLADEKIHEDEMKLLYELASGLNIGKKEVDRIKEEKDNIPFIVPDTDERRFEFIYNFTRMMMADDDIDYREMEICKNYARELGFKKNLVDELVKSISSNVSAGNDLKETYNRLSFVISQNRIQR
ncbi:MAG: TerB family tellurite resistance protein [Cyclobacteriaceae bacterium]